MQQKQQAKLVKIKDFIEFKTCVEEYTDQEFYIIYFSSLGKNVKDLYLLNKLRSILNKIKGGIRNPILIVDSWDAPEAFTFFPDEPISMTPTLVKVQKSGGIRISDDLSFIEEKLIRIIA